MRIAEGRRRPQEWLSAVGIGAWFGITAGLTERAAYGVVPGYLGPVELWYSALLDLLVFAALGLVAIPISKFAPRIRASTIALTLCSIVLALDCVTILTPPFHKLLSLAIGLLAGALLAVPLVRFELSSSRWAGASLLIGLTYVAGYLAVLPGWQLMQEQRQPAMAGRAGAAEPNVIVIVVDALRADHLSAYGYARATSPNLDRLAAQGVLFENAVAPSSWTLPSHATLLTGRLASEHHAGESNWYLDGRLPRIESAFQQLGYRTAAFSGNPFLFSRRVGMGPGFSHFEDGSVLEHLTATNLGRHTQNIVGQIGLLHNVVGRQNAQEISRNASNWIHRNQQPFFTVINYFDVHEPFVPEPGYMQRFSARQPPPDQFMWPNSVVLTPQQVSDEIDAYDACIAYTDLQIYEFLDGLERDGYLKNAIVVITSDHGTSFNEQGFMFHGESLYWEQIHVPLIIYAPGRVSQGIRVATPVAFQSIPATLLDMLDRQTKGTIPGPSLQALWRNPSAAENWPYPVSELAPQGDSPRFPSYYGPMKSMVTPQWHYIEGGNLGEELYKCCTSELPAQDLARTTVGSSVSVELKQVVDQGVRDQAIWAHSKPDANNRPRGTGAAQPSSLPRTKDEAARRRMNEQLHALGYVH